jgi:nitrate/nitrite transporter NarK
MRVADWHRNIVSRHGGRVTLCSTWNTIILTIANSYRQEKRLKASTYVLEVCFSWWPMVSAVGKFVHNRDILLTTAARMSPNIMH